MVIEEDLYALLGFADDEARSGITAAQIRNAWRAQVMQHHPDRGGDIEVFKKIKKAYEILRDEKKRAEYDEDGELSPEDSAIESQAREFVMTAFRMALKDAGTYSLLYHAKRHLQEAMGTQLNVEAEATLAVRELEEHIERHKALITTSMEVNLYHAVLDEDLRIRKSVMPKLEKRKFAFIRALEMLATYSEASIQNFSNAIPARSITLQLK